jgi:hypothetical protein
VALPPVLPCSLEVSWARALRCIHGVVHVNTVVPPGEMVPIGWIAVGDPARIFPPGQHDQIWAIQESLDFPGTVYGAAAHFDDRQL